MSESIESKIKNLREAANLTIEELAKAVGVTLEQMKLIESGDVHPTISVLMKISRFMGVRLGTILDGTEASGPIINSNGDCNPTINIANGSSKSSDHLNFYSLAENKSDRNMEPLMIDVEFQQTSADFSKHEGEEFIYVLDGQINIYYGTETYKLSKGDSIYYDSIVPHLISTPSAEQHAKVLAVTYTPY